jgi:hypothetical protein
MTHSRLALISGGTGSSMALFSIIWIYLDKLYISSLGFNGDSIRKHL